MPVLLTAVAGGLTPTLAAAVAADLLVNWFFVPPYRTLAVGTGDNVATLIVYLLVAAAAGIARRRHRRPHPARPPSTGSAPPCSEPSGTTCAPRWPASKPP